MTNKSGNVYIIHDYQSTSNDHWYPWLSRQVKKLGIDAKRIMLANPLEPKMQDWQQSLAVQIPQMDADTILVAHGLSCLSVLKFIEQHYLTHRKAILGVVMVAGFDQPLVMWSELNDLVRSVKLDFKTLSKSYKYGVMYFSNNDPHVPTAMSLSLAHRLLNTQIFEVLQAGHFEKTDGYADFPQLLEVIQRLYGLNELQNAAGL